MLENCYWWTVVHLQPLLLKGMAFVAAALSAVIVWGEIVSGINSTLSPLHVLVRASQNEFVSQVRSWHRLLLSAVCVAHDFHNANFTCQGEGGR